MPCCPAGEQVERALAIAAEAGARLSGIMTILYVRPDYYGDRPKACMAGWGRRYITVDPVGDVLPCPTARAIAGLSFENVRHRSLDWIWSESEAFNRFRGTGWMPEPCRSCDRARSISAAADARPPCSPATRPPPIRRARFRRTAIGSTRRYGPGSLQN